ncbi:MAG: nucleoside-diphosphate-sugar epimerase [Planctomycetota bacterium]
MKAVVTGGGGFLGRVIVEFLLAEGFDVWSLSRGRHEELERLGAKTVRCDLSDELPNLDACRDADIVYHVAAKAGVFGKARDYERINVAGTQRVLDACRRFGVPKLVYTSSPSVCFDGKDHLLASNDLPYATRFLASYPETKARAERAVLEANDASLATCALRPHLIFGPRDPHLIPRLLERAKQGRLAIVGDGNNEVSMTYVENAAAAHLAAGRTLTPTSAHAGRAYFISQEEPVKLWTWIAEVLAAAGAPPIRKKLSLRTAYGLGATLEFVWRALRLSGEPPMTRFVAAQLASSHSYTMDPARRDFGYRETIDVAEATRRMLASL